MIVSGMADTFGEILIVSGMTDTFGRIIDLGVNPGIEPKKPQDGRNLLKKEDCAHFCMLKMNS